MNGLTQLLTEKRSKLGSITALASDLRQRRAKAEAEAQKAEFECLEQNATREREEAGRIYEDKIRTEEKVKEEHRRFLRALEEAERAQVPRVATFGAGSTANKPSKFRR